MSNQTLIERYRNRLIAAKLNAMMMKTNSHCIAVNLNDCSMCTIELSEEILRRALHVFFEVPVYSEYTRCKADNYILNSYRDYLSKYGGLTGEGDDFMQALVKLIAERAKHGGFLPEYTFQ
ncbi:hypothetical protein CKY10_21800 [Photorhabdus sp. HUG-39]|uniref:Uncharacterized protein n=2 Tax=Photorhabdus TaxID=29487 RepID=A0ABX0B4R6_9GAMM|nr:MULTISPECIES: hypothetical protein [Photorhabdus]MCC8375582.1 hypothetical protein [Photorhabdus bodei]MDB6366709.1 hypothetical protein [Photorhabdus bodei]MDB6374924.1 hypothetical protein [Photorhabdus bodei]NDL14296.1 hypothetical protein [Photorhabdus kayaii]NDL27825.1 hypothetical protein [Photorhabdus kayaii]